ncbi:MAG: hypothetical protein JRN15_04230 [Nitrososphaerota archaeon]|nr:hypothetical protein [Nitrososphaerota archaeon]
MSTRRGEEAYFVAYASKVAKMKSWQLANELAVRLGDFDLFKEDNNSDTEDETQSMKKTMRQIEILTKENLRRKR